jgi:hypothetical protein
VVSCRFVDNRGAVATRPRGRSLLLPPTSRTDGTDGTDGTAGVLGYELVAASKPVQAGQADAVEVACPAGKMVLGGSGFFNNTNQAVQFEIRSGGTSGKAWTTGAPADATLLVNVVCALVGP